MHNTSRQDFENQTREIFEDFLLDQLHEIPIRQQRGEQLQPKEELAVSLTHTICREDIHHPELPAGPKNNNEEIVQVLGKAANTEIQRSECPYKGTTSRHDGHDRTTFSGNRWQFFC